MSAIGPTVGQIKYYRAVRWVLAKRQEPQTSGASYADVIFNGLLIREGSRAMSVGI